MAFLVSERWVAAKGRELTGVRLMDHGRLPHGSAVTIRTLTELITDFGIRQRRRSQRDASLITGWASLGPLLNGARRLVPSKTLPVCVSLSTSVKELERIAVNDAANAVLKDAPGCSAQDLSMLAEWETSSQGFVLRWHFAAAQPGRAWFLPRSWGGRNARDPVSACGEQAEDSHSQDA